MADRIYKCNSGHIKAFPLVLKQRPTRDQYTTGVDLVQGLIDLQWAPTSPAPTTETSTTGSIYLQKGDPTSSQSTVIYNTLSYTITNVQMTQSQHSNWLIADPGQTNKEDLVILLQANSPNKQELIYTIFVIPLLNTGSETTDPEYLKNANVPGVLSGAGIQSCFPTKTFPTKTTSAPLFANYVTCFDGYTNHARTQNIDVFISTVGIPVSSATLNRIKKGFTPGVIELPTIIQNSYYIPPAAGAVTAAGAGAYTGLDGITSINPEQLKDSRIRTTTFSAELSNIGNVAQKRADSTGAYQCVELDPNDVDANNTIHIDMKNGKIASSTLEDILAEREVVKKLVNPDVAITPEARTKTRIYQFVLTLIIILLTFGGLFLFVFSTDTKNSRNIWEIVLSSIIALTLLIAAGFGFLSNDDNLRVIGGWMALASAIAGLLFFLWFYVWDPPPNTTECGKALNALAKGAASGAGVPAAPVAANAANAANAENGWQGFFNRWKGTAIQTGVTGAVFGLLGFIIGNIV